MRRAIKAPTKCKIGKFTWQKVDVSAGPDGCWPWVGIINRWGYGQCQFDGKNCNASRAAFLSAHGEIGGGLVVCHRCDNPSCCNPAHLFAATQAENLADCRKKGRAAGQFGSASSHPRHTAKMTPALVIEARQLCASGLSHSEVARRMGFDTSTVSRAVRGESWKHLP